MDPQVLKWLRIMGFDCEVIDMKHLKMKTLDSQWRKMTLLKHPDKPGGKKEDFQELMDAYENLGKIIEETIPEDLQDMEEVNARKAFKDVNFTAENVSSITINIDTNMFKSWEFILTEKLGEPNDRSGKNNGKQWVDEAFKADKEEKTSKVYITVWNKEKNEKSTMLIQAEKSHHYLNVSYVTKVIPKLYENVLDHFEKENVAVVDNKKAPKSKPLQSPTKGKRTRTSRKVGNTPSCKLCVFSAKNISQLNDHMVSIHKKRVVANKSEQPEVTPYKPPTLSATQLVDISYDNEVNKICHCYVCKTGFENYQDLAVHEKAHHEVSCTFCSEVFFTNSGLKDHVINVHVQHQKTGQESLENTINGVRNTRTDDDSFHYDLPINSVASNKGDNSVTPIVRQIDDLEKDTNEKEEITAPRKKVIMANESTDDKCPSPNIDSFDFDEAQAKEVHTQTDNIIQVCDSNLNQGEHFKVLEKEHVQLKDLYDKIRDAYYKQGDEKQELDNKIIELQDKKSEQEKEITKLKRDFAKTEKNLDLKIKDMENTLKECYEQVNKCEQENVRLKEENKVLEELRKINEDDNVPKENYEVEAEVIDIQDDDPNDDDVIAFYLTQNMNRSTRKINEVDNVPNEIH